MNTNDKGAGAGRDDSQLALWLQQVLTLPPSTKARATGEGGIPDLVLESDYHLRFYQQIPDFIMALLQDDPHATIRYATLLYHLAGCSECHHEYLQLYDALRAAIAPRTSRQYLGQGTRTLEATPQHMLGHLSRTLISQAEAVLLEARRVRSNQDETARALLRLALSLSARIRQSYIRQQALQNLVHVATLFDEASHHSEGRTYVAVLEGAGGARRGGRRAVRRAETVTRPQDQALIVLQSPPLAGHIVQREQVLELHLRDLDAGLREQHVTISVLLGPLLEPIRWTGGNPHAIRSSSPVREDGTLVTPLGETELSLTNAEDRNLLEAIFLRLTVNRSV